MNKTLLTLALAGLAMLGVRSLNRMFRTGTAREERATPGLFV